MSYSTASHALDLKMAEVPRRLGRGLASMLGETTPEVRPVGTPQLLVIPVDALRPNPRQPRSVIPPESLRDLTASIAARGVLQPLLVRPIEQLPGQYEIIAGERRWRAARNAGLGGVPCMVDVVPDESAALAALVENLQREDLTALDEAEGYRLVVERFQLTQESLARAVGKSRSHIANTLRLLDLPERVRLALSDRKISAGHARALLAHPDPDRALAIVLEQDLNVRATEALASGAAPNSATLDRRSDRTSNITASKPRPEPRASIEADSVQRMLSDSLGLVVGLRDRGGHGRLVIEYRTNDQLDGLIKLLVPDK